jgi:aryl carrier-like protein
MRVLGLVLAWGNTGIPLEFSHLAEHATLSDWWTVVQRLQAQAPASA